MKRYFFRELGLIVLVMLVAEIGALQSAWGGFQKGVVAQRENDYATALKEFRPLAEHDVLHRPSSAQRDNSKGPRQNQALTISFARLQMCAKL